MTPVFCPNLHCRHHHDDRSPTRETWWVPVGSHMTKVVGRVQRFQCRSCGKTFSTRTFELDYYAKKSIPYREIFDRLPAGASVSALARGLRCSVASAQNRLDRLARNCIAFHESLLRGHTLAEDLVADGFESFDRSQFFPNNVNLLVGKDSQTLYASTHVTLRRKGRMTPSQRRRRARYEETWKAPGKGVETSFAQLLTVIPALWDPARKPTLVLSTDEHRAYPRSIARVGDLTIHAATGSFVHRTYSSKASRTTDNPLFPVNYFDRELRKDLPAYHRESTCFCRNVANGRLRFAVYQAWHNYRKPHRIVYTRERPPVHAVKAGMDKARIERGLADLCVQRAFLSKSDLSWEGRNVWLKASSTPFKARPEYLPKYQAREQ